MEGLMKQLVGMGILTATAFILRCFLRSGSFARIDNHNLVAAGPDFGIIASLCLMGTALVWLLVVARAWLAVN
jgi:hypothetical protein